MIIDDSARTKELLIRKNMEMSAILEVSRVLTSSFDLEDNLSSAMKILSRNLDMQRGCVFLFTPMSQELKIVAAHGLSRDEILRGNYKIGEGIVGTVIKNRTPMFIPNIGQEPKFLNKTGSRPEKCGISFLCMPITLKDDILGVISVDRIYTEEHGSVDDDLRVLSIVSSFIAQFVKLWETFINAENERERLKCQLQERYSLPNIIGESERFQSVLKAVHKVACTDTTTLLLGESGTGKELIAQTLHYLSNRAEGPFVAVNIAALPENLIEVELFGTEKGAFTGAMMRRIGRFEHADKGTLFLDEIGEIPLPLQAKLLRVLQEKSFERLGSSKPIKVDVRVIAATNRNLQEEVKKGNFRDDLYWRLNVFPIVMPALRERITDIPLLAQYYLKKFNTRYQKDVFFMEEAYRMMQDYDWPGNVRELANAVERVVIMAEKSEIGFEDLPLEVIGATKKIQITPAPVNSDLEGINSLSSEVELLEKRRIILALQENDYIQHRTAISLGITPRQLGYRIKKYGIQLKR